MSTNKLTYTDERLSVRIADFAAAGITYLFGGFILLASLTIICFFTYIGLHLLSKYLPWLFLAFVSATLAFCSHYTLSKKAEQTNVFVRETLAWTCLAWTFVTMLICVGNAVL